VTFASPNQPSAYAWEATDEEVAARYGVPIEDVVRFDVNTAPLPPDLAHRVMATGRFPVSLSEYPPSDYRLLVEAAAARYGVGTDELVVGAGADEILDVIAKTFLAEGSRAVIPVPTYAMYRVLTEQRPADVIAVARRPQADGFALDVSAVRAAARGASLVWLCSPNNPTGLPEPEGVVEALLEGLLADAAAAGSVPPVVVLDEAYAEFTRRTLLPLREEYAGLVVVRTLSKVYALAGLRVGFAVARPELIAAMAPYRPPGSVSVVSVSIAADMLGDDGAVAAGRERIERERTRLRGGLRAVGWRVGESVTNFLLVDFASPERAAAVAEALLRRGLVPRTFPAGHPLAHCLRLTVRNEEQDDRLIAAARELGA
jgi:histidinol-phosphate aminotransferase